MINVLTGILLLAIMGLAGWNFVQAVRPGLEGRERVVMALVGFSLASVALYVALTALR